MGQSRWAGFHARLIAGALGTILMLAGCGGDQEPAQSDPAEEASRNALASILEAESTVKGSLRNPKSAKFSDTGLYAGRDGKRRVCGLVNSENGFGGMTGPQRFVAGNGHAFLAEEMAADLMAKLWKEACPAEGLVRKGLS